MKKEIKVMANRIYKNIISQFGLKWFTEPTNEWEETGWDICGIPENLETIEYYIEIPKIAKRLTINDIMKFTGDTKENVKYNIDLEGNNYLQDICYKMLTEEIENLYKKEYKKSDLIEGF